MYIINKKNKAGFTLIETLVSLAIGLVISGVTAAILVSGFANVRHAKTEERLHANTVRVTDSLTYLIKDSDRLEINSNILEIHLPSGETKDVELQDGRIMIGGEALTDSSINVTSLSFESVEGSIRLSFIMESESGNDSLSTTTTIAKRNKL
ncbi:MAG: prepilin-type N-terminal cleavage/methylation domain-containing protein [Candidatus Spechtbacterales bacterium]|nr:prepilin-type N-terminal cleavage/methylation domain-containing protein [Candidatus Spechtbacterales bacterium]